MLIKQLYFVRPKGDDPSSSRVLSSSVHNLGEGESLDLTLSLEVTAVLNELVVSLAIDYGLTGMVIGLHKLAVERPKPDYQKAWRGATRGLMSLGVTEGAGLKWPWYTRSTEPYR